MPCMKPLSGPSSPARRSFIPPALLAVGAGLRPAATAAADVVLMDHAFVLRGKIHREGDFWVQAPDVWVPRDGGFYMVDDKVRRVVFNQRFVSEAVPDPEDKEQLDKIDFERPPLWNPATPVAHAVGIEELGK